MAKPLTRAPEQQRVGSGGPAEASATETSGAVRPETHIMAGPPVPIQNNRGGPIGESAARTAEGRSATAQSEAATLGRERESPASPATFPTREQFSEMFKHLRLSFHEPYYEAIRDACAEFGIDTPLRVAAFLAQVGHETMGLQFLEELGGIQHWKDYEGRRDLGNTTQGDGIKYHGRGLVQLTGKANYVEFGRRLGLDLAGDPGQAGKMPAAARIGAAFWSMRGLSAFADLNSEDGFQRMTKRLNGGLLGYTDRHARWKAIRKIMGIDPKGK